MRAQRFVTSFTLLAAVLVTLAVASSRSSAAPEEAAKPTRLDALKKLAGTWRGPTEDGKPGPTVTYRVTSAGSAVEEVLFGGTDHEMVTMYVMDKGDLMLTHYCAMGNQPRMKALPEKDAKVVAFEFLDGTNMKSRDDMHMDSLTLTMKDATHLHQEWTMWKDGKVVRNVSLDFEKADK